ncbi:hypothetical protein CANCADRAFT_30703 [Tortispora caseinolytica NRRL Y-17796]|uniref:Serine/threonine-protein kinase SCH9 n=1 Tax=Tortispora caseinolytica NRRL Y-17796 TaxID=767744 RepID=A0A1E4TLE5_9ASCO|nr:hypothetical protein CANCADRAFT_30703 [Tortispora caseinolytica NRRL Y-17796]
MTDHSTKYCLTPTLSPQQLCDVSLVSRPQTPIVPSDHQASGTLYNPHESAHDRLAKLEYSSLKTPSSNQKSSLYSQNSSDYRLSNSSNTCLNESTDMGSDLFNTEAQVSLTESVAPPKGRLYIRIVEARDLHTSATDAKPYVVCTFESNEAYSGVAALSTRESRKPSPDGDSTSSRTVSIAIPKSKTSSMQSHQNKSVSTSSSWKYEATFDVTNPNSELEIQVYDSNDNDRFLGFVRFCPDLQDEKSHERWYKLLPRTPEDTVSGEIKVSTTHTPINKRHYSPDDFEILRLVGKGTFGQVYQVRKRDTQRIYAMKVLSKKVIVQKKEIAHTIGERNILVRTSSTVSPFIVSLKFSFQTPTDLYFVTDYMSGGELFWHLQREGRFSEERAKFYIAELILALQHLHSNNIVYRDLKPENILLDANGHIALCDFGLSKADLPSNMTTNTFCGTTEYLAPEVLLDDSGYTRMVDFWSLGVLIFEMCCGWSPFYAEDTQQMYKNIAFGKVRFPKDALSSHGRNLVKGLLNRNPNHRLGAVNDAQELREHPFFSDIDWNLLLQKKIPPPFKPHVTSEADTSNFDPEFTGVSTSALNRAYIGSGSTPLSPGVQANFQGFTFVDESAMSYNYRSARGPIDTEMDFIEEDDDSLNDPMPQRQGHASLDYDDVDDADGARRMSGIETMNDDDHFIPSEHFII